VGLPADSHVHSEWSWDARNGDMERTCARAIEIGLPAVAFTEHLDHTAWQMDLNEGDPGHDLVGPDGVLTPPAFDADGYLAAVARCRDRFPGLRILSGVEMGEPHWHAAACARVLGAGQFDRVLGSLHSLPEQGGFVEPSGAFPLRDAHQVMRDYLAGVVEMVEANDLFAVLAHIDYPVRYWPTAQAGPFEPAAFEAEFRAALRATAQSGIALEINTALPLHETILTWWREEGGAAVSFGSDAHQPEELGRGFADAARMAEAHGFRAGRQPYELWRRR
jgi:histidinol-phosphatase (PHP family)